MRRMHLDLSLQFCVYPGVADAAAGENERMHLPPGVDHGKPDIAVVRDIVGGRDLMPHAGMPTMGAGNLL
jgi:hypothetical protein